MSDSVTTPGQGPPPPPRRRRRVWGLVWLAAVLGTLLALAYTAPVHRWAFGRFAARLEKGAGTVLRATRISLDPLSLTLTLDGVTIASAATPATPYLTASHVDLAFAAPILLGTPTLERIRIVDAVVDMEKVAPGRPGGEPFRGLGSLQADDVAIENLTLLLGGPDEARMALRRLSVRGVGDAPGRIRFDTISPATLLLEIADAKIPFDAVTGTFTMDGDRANIARLTGHSDTAHVEMRGLARFDHGYPLQVDYEASIDVPKSSAWWAMTSTLKGRAVLTGRITGPLASPVATAKADVPGFAWRTLSPGRLSATGAISLAGIRLETFTLAVPEMTARGTGFLSWADLAAPNPPRSTIDARWHAPLLRNVGPLVELDPADIPLVAADGTAKVNWPGFVPDLGLLAGTLRAQLTSGLADGGDDHGTVHMAGADAKWHVIFEEHLPGETVARGSADVRLNALEFGRSTMTGHLDASIGDAAPMLKRAAALDVPVPDSALTRLDHGRAQLSGRLSGTVAMPRWHASVDATDVVLSGLRGITVGGSFDVDPDFFVTDDLTLRAPGTTVRMRGNIGVLRDTSELLFDGDVDAAWASTPFVPAGWPLAGQVPVTGRWVTDVDRDDLEVAFDAPAGTLAGKPIGPVRGRVLSGLTTITGDVSLPELGARFSGTYDLTDALAHSGRAEFVQAEIARWLALTGTPAEALDGVALTFDGTADASGSFESIETSRITATLTGLSGEVRGRPVRLEAPAVLRWDRGTLDAGEAVITAGGARISVAPAADAPGTSAITMTSSLADVIALLPAGAMPPGLTVDGSLRIDARLTHKDPYNPTVKVVADATSVVKDAVQVAKDLHAEAVLSGDLLAVPSLTGVVMGANVNATASAPARWVAPWVTESPRASGPPSARLTGAIDAPLSAVAEALGAAAAEIGGSARVVVDLRADSPALQAVRGTLTAERLSIDTKTGTFSADGPGRIRLADGRAVIETLAMKGPESRLEASGGFALAADGAVDVRLAGTASMGIIDALVAPRVSGAADVELRVAGTVAKPTLDGSLTLRDVSALTPDARLVLARLGGRINFTPGLVQVVGVEGQLNGGILTLSGDVPLSGPSAGHELRLNARDVFVEYPSGLRSRLSVDLTLSGGLEAPELRGTTTIQADPYRETLPQMAQLLAAMGQTSRAAAGGEPGFVDRIALNVALSAPVPLRLDNSLGKVEVMPDIRIVGTVAEPAVVGPVDILDGSRVFLQSRTYTLTDSRLEFSAEDGFVPRLQVVGSTKVGEYDVTLRIDGPADAMEMNLSSLPPLPERDLRALLLTGQTEDASGAGETSSQFTLTALSSDLLGMAGQALGFDNVRIGSESFELVSSDLNPTTRLTMSKRFLDRFELVYSDNLEDNTATWMVIYQPRGNIELRASSRDNLDRVIEFRHRLSFGPGAAPARATAGDTRRLREERRKEIVSATSITGVPPDTAARLRSLVKLKPGAAFAYESWRGDHERIRRFFTDAGYLTARVIPTRDATEAARDGAPTVALAYAIARGPLTAIVVSGTAADARLMGPMREAWARTTFEESAAADLSRAARQELIGRGYVQPEVTTTIAESGPGRLLATVEITPGPKPSKRSVEFDGMTVLSELDLVALAVGAGMKDTVWRDPGTLCLLVKQAYAARGYRNAAVEAQPLRVAGDTVILPIWINEGTVTRVGQVEVTGVPAALAAGAVAAAALTPGAPMPVGEERAARVRIEQHLRNLGFRNATVGLQARGPAPDGALALRFAVTTGRQQVLQSVRVEGAVTTRASVIQQALQLTPGTPAGQETIAAAQRRLYQLGVFSTAHIRLVPSPAAPGRPPADTVPVTAVVSLAEPRKYQFVYGLEASNAYGPIFENVENSLGIAADVRDRNLFGRGLTGSVGARYEADLRSARTLFSAPTLWSKRIRTNLYLSWRAETLRDPDGSVADFVSKNATIEQRWRPRSWMDLTWGYTISDRRVDGVLVRDREVSDLSAGGILASVNGTVVIDRRDNALDATGGWFHSSSVQEGSRALASDFRFTRYLGRVYYYFSPADRIVLATGARAGWIWNIGGRATLDVVDLLFKAGGSQTVRGYKQDQLSASTVEGLPLGGARLLVLNEELRFRFSRLFQGVVFADAGNTFTTGQFAWRDLAVGLGFGVRINTPIAPLRLDVGFPVPRRPGDRLFRWYVGVGQTF